MAEPIDVDVQILSWNRAEETMAAIDSALAQRDVSAHVWVVDQGSEPANLQAMREFAAARPRMTLHELGHNVGVAAGRNIAARLGSAPVIVALDNDAIFSDEHMLARAVLRLQNAPELGAVGFRILNFFTGGDDFTSWDYPTAMRAHTQDEFWVTRFVGAGHAIRRRAFDAACGYDDRLFFGGEERDLCYRIINVGYRIRYVPTISVRHKIAAEGRVRWDAGRYYYAVRNTLYIEFKFGEPWWRLARSAAAMTARGAYNGMPLQSLRAVAHAIGMANRFSRSDDDREVYLLSREVRAYLRDCEMVDEESLWRKLRKQFQMLPGRA
jgi:GT2 family glycosyltransferase